MTKREAEHRVYLHNTLMALGFTDDEAEALRRISMTLHRWFEHECNGTIQRDGENGDGAPFYYNPDTGRRHGRAPDREAGAMKRLRGIIEARNMRVFQEYPTRENTDLTFYIQSDPRGAVLYIIRPGDIPEGADVHVYYARGFCVC
jgi:hypothetical protein